MSRKVYRYDPTHKDWGGELKKHRKKSGISQEDLGVAIGVSGKVVCDWENGRRSPTLKHIESAFDLLGLELVLKRKQG